ncbi:hypothetical protein [Streptantibioticus silvisoli]|uniref:PH domain-containing protein n=1 Tax=Streptantibioticus silvisoli TaxID=2705255 RepID=A0ABT6W067_9ACTN|nr:hypothetical protein [Streptantibioticus silvisoli]MDI5963362.1 hypothetical protein [Streptantibioticus silvisoli]
MGHERERDDAARPARSGRGPASTPADREWARDAWFAAGCGTVFGAMELGVLLVTGALTGPWVALCVLAGAVAFAVLLPARVRAGDGWLAARGLLLRHVVHTDALVAVRLTGVVAVHVVLRDAGGQLLAVDARVLAANPPLLRALDAGVRVSRERGTLPPAPDPLRDLRAAAIVRPPTVLPPVARPPVARPPVTAGPRPAPPAPAVHAAHAGSHRP